MAKTPQKKIDAVDAHQKDRDEVIKRVARNKARRHALKAGLVHVGDGKELDHKKMLDGGGSSADSNVRVVSEKFNKQWRKRDPKAYTKK